MPRQIPDSNPKPNQTGWIAYTSEKKSKYIDDFPVQGKMDWLINRLLEHDDSADKSDPERGTPGGSEAEKMRELDEGDS